MLVEERLLSDPLELIVLGLHGRLEWRGLLANVGPNAHLIAHTWLGCIQLPRPPTLGNKWCVLVGIQGKGISPGITTLLLGTTSHHLLEHSLSLSLSLSLSHTRFERSHPQAGAQIRTPVHYSAGSAHVSHHQSNAMCLEQKRMKFDAPARLF